MNRTICVFCSSSEALSPVYFEAAHSLGAELARRGDTLVYGGGNVGLMGALARAVHAHGGKVVGVIPRALQERDLAYVHADELIVTKDLRERKAIMESYAEAFIAMPGGYGTLEEMLEALTLKQLHFHSKPLVFLDTGGFYAPLIALFEQMYEQHFAKPRSRGLYRLAENPGAALDYIDRYEPEAFESKWWENRGNGIEDPPQQ